MLNLPDTLVWIDHHETSIRESIEKNFTPLGIRDVSKAACELTWEYLFPNREIPWAVTLLGRYDVWDFEDGDDVGCFQYGMRVKDNEPTSPLWNLLFELTSNKDGIKFICSIISEGNIVYDYLEENNEKYANSFSFETILDGYSCICCNRGATNSKLFDSVWDEKCHDIMVTFCRTNDKHWLVSLYTTHKNIDCGKIAKKYGGGGHRGASGFKCKALPFEI